MEIVKSILGMKDDIDLNGQAKEIGILLDAIGNAILKSRNGDGHKVNEKNITTLAVYIMEAINDYVYKLDPKKIDYANNYRRCGGLGGADAGDIRRKRNENNRFFDRRCGEQLHRLQGRER